MKSTTFLAILLTGCATSFSAHPLRLDSVMGSASIEHCRAVAGHPLEPICSPEIVCDRVQGAHMGDVFAGMVTGLVAYFGGLL